MPVKGIDLERDRLAVAWLQALPFQINLDLERRLIGGEREQRLDDLLIEHDRQQTVLDRVLPEDVGEARRDQHPKAIPVQRPGCMLARRAAAEIMPREQDLGPGIAWIIEHEVRVQRPARAVLPRLAVVQIAPFIEQVRAEAGALNRLQELLWDDRIGIDIGAIERHDPAAKGLEWLHHANSR